MYWQTSLNFVEYAEQNYKVPFVLPNSCNLYIQTSPNLVELSTFARLWAFKKQLVESELYVRVLFTFLIVTEVYAAT